MTIFRLPEELLFPDPSLSEDDGLLAVGGDLEPGRLLLAYQQGIFPWYSEGDPILWWSPNPRLLIYPCEVHVSRSMRRFLAQGKFQVTFDQDFPAVIRACADTPREGQPGTWIIPAMTEAYQRLHELGFAHSVEVWDGDTLAGGLYGVSLGGAFFGESMFSHQTNGSKTALISLCQQLDRWGFSMLDCQMPTSHLLSLGGVEVPKELFLTQLSQAMSTATRQGGWVYGGD